MIDEHIDGSRRGHAFAFGKDDLVEADGSASDPDLGAFGGAGGVGDPEQRYDAALLPKDGPAYAQRVLDPLQLHGAVVGQIRHRPAWNWLLSIWLRGQEPHRSVR